MVRDWIRERRTVRRPMASRPIASAPIASAPTAVAPRASAPTEAAERARGLRLAARANLDMFQCNPEGRAQPRAEWPPPPVTVANSGGNRRRAHRAEWILVESVFLVGISPARDARRAQASPGLDGQVEARSMIFEGQIGADVRGVGRIPCVTLSPFIFTRARHTKPRGQRITGRPRMGTSRPSI